MDDARENPYRPPSRIPSAREGIPWGDVAFYAFTFLCTVVVLATVAIWAVLMVRRYFLS